MRVTVDYDRCASTGSCMQTCPEVFDLDRDGRVHVLQPSPDESLRDAVTAAAELCPTQAIQVED